jgi:hypothetical protein
MNSARIGLALFAAAWLALTATAAPVPVPVVPSAGTIADLLRLRDLLPQTAPLNVVPAVMGKEGKIELEYRGLAPEAVTMQVRRVVPVAREVAERVQTPDGRVEVRKVVVYENREVTEERRVTVMRPVGKGQAVPVAVKSCKFFVVNREGKLDALDTAKATAMLKQKTAILTGDSVELPPRALDLVKAGTLFLVVSHSPPQPVPMPPRDEKEEKRR